MQRCRHPDLDAYIGDAVSALRRPIAAGDVKRVVLAIKDDDAAASDGPLERFTFDFLLRDDDDTAGGGDTAGGLNGGGVADVTGGSVRGPSRAAVDQCQRAFAACLSKKEEKQGGQHKRSRSSLANVLADKSEFEARLFSNPAVPSKKWSPSKRAESTQIVINALHTS